MRAAFLLSLGLVMLGSCGVTNGAALASTKARPMLPAIEADDPAIRDAMSRVVEIEQEIALGTPHRRALGAANAVVSLMLVVGSFLLVTRNAATVWWVKNAVLANILVHWGVLLDGVAYGYAKRRALLGAFEQLARANDATITSAMASSLAHGQTYFLLGSVVVAGIVVTLVHLYLAYRVSRDDIREFLEARASS